MEKDTRPWGSYEVIAGDDFFKAKKIVVKPNSILSLQLHHKRSEHWIIVKGTGFVTKGEDILEVKANESVYIPVEHKHRIENRSDSEELVFIEVQCGTYFGEDDIVRFEDNYGRA